MEVGLQFERGNERMRDKEVRKEDKRERRGVKILEEENETLGIGYMVFQAAEVEWLLFTS